MSFYSYDELIKLGFKFVGKNVKISKNASFYNQSFISINDNTRIDDFCVLSAGENGIEIGKNVHLAVFSSLIGNGKIVIKDYANISSRVSIYSSNDDYSGEFMTNPTVPSKFTNVTVGPVTIGKHVLIGSGSVILPNVELMEGACIGSLSLVNKSCKPFKIYGGVPIRYLKERSNNLLNKENEWKNNGE